MWTKVAAEARPKMPGWTLATLPERAGDLERLGKDLTAKGAGRDESRSRGVSVVGATLAVALVSRGWALEAEPDDEVTLRRGEWVISPFTLYSDLEEARLTSEQWRATCAAAQIADLDLGQAPPG